MFILYQRSFDNSVAFATFLKINENFLSPYIISYTIPLIYNNLFYSCTYSSNYSIYPEWISHQLPIQAPDKDTLKLPTQAHDRDTLHYTYTCSRQGHTTTHLYIGSRQRHTKPYLHRLPTGIYYNIYTHYQSPTRKRVLCLVEIT